jgi:hypothetical protein
VGQLKDAITAAITDVQVAKRQRRTRKVKVDPLRFAKLLAALKDVFKMFPSLLGPDKVLKKNFASIFREFFERLIETPAAAFKRPFNGVSIFWSAAVMNAR